MRRSHLVVFVFCFIRLHCQFAPPVGQAGTTAMYKDSAAFVNWASSCTITRGYQDISSPGNGYASVGDSSFALGISGSNGVVSLGDGGSAIVQFPFPVTDGPGYDFAVFENSFSDDYLELAFVEVSSDGVNFFRFPATSNTQDSAQVGPFDLLDATRINNLAGKYRMYYGTPFDLNELSGSPGLDLSNITHIRITDVIGSIQATYATYDMNSNRVNDPWPTAFASSGFDLDAVGVIHQNNSIGMEENSNNEASANCFSYYDPEGNLHVQVRVKQDEQLLIEMLDACGKKIGGRMIHYRAGEFFNFSFGNGSLARGIYFLNFTYRDGSRLTKKIIIP